MYAGFVDIPVVIPFEFALKIFSNSVVLNLQYAGIEYPLSKINGFALVPNVVDVVDGVVVVDVVVDVVDEVVDEVDAGVVVDEGGIEFAAFVFLDNA